MKVIEILEQYDTVRKERTRKKPFDYDYLNRLGTSGGEEKKGGGQGWYSRGVPHPTDPHTFIKSTKLTSKLKDDAFHKYIEMVVALRRKGIANSFFPTVYEIKVTKDPNNSTRPSYHLQALDKYRRYDADVLAGLARKLFKGFEGQAESDEDLKDTYSIWNYICNECSYAVRNGDYKNIEDEELIAALRYVRALVWRHRYDVDMHTGNFLLRGSSTGPQLVISDPVSDSGKSIPRASEVNQGPEGAAELRQAAEKKLKQRNTPKTPAQEYTVIYQTGRFGGWKKLLDLPAISQRHADLLWDRIYFRDAFEMPSGERYIDFWDTKVLPRAEAEQILTRKVVKIVRPQPSSQQSAQQLPDTNTNFSSGITPAGDYS